MLAASDSEAKVPTMADTASSINDASAKTERALEEELQKLVGSDSFARLLSRRRWARRWA